MVASSHKRSLIEDAARAWWLVEIPLLDERAEEADFRAAIRLRLRDEKEMDAETCRQVVERCFGKDEDSLENGQKWVGTSGQSAFRGPALLLNTQLLCEDLFDMAFGLPQFKPDFRLHRLSRVIDPDGLVCLDARVNLPFDERYDWPAIPMGEGGNASGLLCEYSVDSHIHLGGTLPPLFYWVALMGGEISMDALNLYPTDHIRSTKGKLLWHGAVCRAMALRLCLAARVQKYFLLHHGRRVFPHLPNPPSRNEVSRPPWYRYVSIPPTRFRLSDPSIKHPRRTKRCLARFLRLALRYVPDQPWFDLEPRLRPAFADARSTGRAVIPQYLPAPAEIRGVALGLSQQQRFSIAPKDRWPLTDPLRQERSQALGGSHYAEGERRLLVHAARLLRESHNEDDCIQVETALLAYLRIRNAFHRKLVHDHGSEGLMSFMESFSRRGFYFGERKSIARIKAAKENPNAGLRERTLLRRNKRRRIERLLEGGRMKAALDMQLVEAYAPTPALPASVLSSQGSATPSSLSVYRSANSLANRECRVNSNMNDLLGRFEDLLSLPAGEGKPALLMMRDLLEAFTHEGREEPKNGPNTPLPGPLRRIEMRVSLPQGNQTMRIIHVWLEAIAAHLRTAKGIRNHQVGLLFHLLKKSNTALCANEARRQTESLCHLLHDYPGLRRYIVGIDAAGEERHAEPRLFAQSFRHLRQCEGKLRPHPEHPSLHMGWTYHAGEDSDDMLTALRHIDEVVRLLLPQDRPARLGHALLLGESSERYYQRHRGELVVKRGRHLLDLVWAQGMLGENRHPEQVIRLRGRIIELIGKEGRTPRIERCFEAMEAGSKDAQENVKTEAELLAILRVNAKDAGEFKTLNADSDWIAMVGILQQELRESLTRRRIAIEANPTSNLIIGGYPHYRDLPYTTLVEAGLPLSINTDDPGLFMSSLPGEFASMYKALAETMRHREALAWLRERQFDAQQSSFLGNVPIGAENPILTQTGLNWVFRFDP